MKEQIEEMCEVLRQNAESCKTCSWYEEGLCIGNCELAEDNQTVCETLYNAGYRKQKEGEWISVEDKFPDVDKILGWDGTAMWFFDAKGICESLQNVISKNGITHWLPIPEPPRMKGENNEKI